MSKKKTIDDIKSQYNNQEEKIVEHYKTGINTLDDILGVGLPIGHVVGFGAEHGVGKTTLLLQISKHIINHYKKEVYYIDVEGGLTQEIKYSVGISDLEYYKESNPDGLFHHLEATTMQDIAYIIKILSSNTNVGLIVIDTATMVIDQSLLEDESLGSKNTAFGIDARMWSSNGKYLQACIKESNACLVLLHQARIDLYGKTPKLVAAGGRATRHIVSIELWGKWSGYFDENYNPTPNPHNSNGFNIVLETRKNRFHIPYREISLPLICGVGVSKAYLMYEWLKSHGPIKSNSETYITQKHSWYYIDIPSIGPVEKLHGLTSVWEWILRNKDKINKLITHESK
jgi:RecA/RadA recombinase